MTGHPWITYNKGRIGFGYDDYIKYAPEQKKKRYSCHGLQSIKKDRELSFGRRAIL
ncbi:hypothetical protein GCM10020331_090090 [Ectobacillus funiculus]